QNQRRKLFPARLRNAPLLLLRKRRRQVCPQHPPKTQKIAGRQYPQQTSLQLLLKSRWRPTGTKPASLFPIGRPIQQKSEKFLYCNSAVTDPVFFRSIQLGEGFVIALRDKQRVVAKAALPGRLVANISFNAPLEEVFFPFQD